MMLPSFLRRPTLWTATGLVLAVAACSDNDKPSITDPAPPPPAPTVPAVALQRLAISDNTLSSLKIVSVESGALIETVGLRGGPASLLYRSPSGRFAVAQQRTQGLVDFIDGGIEARTAGAYRRLTPSILSWNLTGPLPTHENVNGSMISVFFDGDGVAKWINENDLLAGSPRVAQEFNSGGAHHSGSSTMLLPGGGVAFVYAPLNPAGGLPTAVVARNAAGQELARTEACPSMHGNGANSQGVVFGCVDGFILGRPSGAGASLTKITMSGELTGSGVRTVWGKTAAPFVVGRASTPGGVSPAIRQLVRIDGNTGAILPFPLPAGERDFQVVIDELTNRVSVLAHSGSVFIFNGNTAQLERTVTGVVPTIPLTGALTHTLASARDRAWVTSPTTGEVVEVNTAAGSVVRRLNVGGAPTRIAVLGVLETGTFTIDE
jgi:hypothetical protein